MALIMLITLFPFNIMSAAAEEGQPTVNQPAAEKQVSAPVSETPYLTGTPEEGEITYPVEINKENFPDQAFRGYVSEEFDKDGSKSLTEQEISLILTINPMDYLVKTYQVINSFEGIEYFFNLKNVYCYRCVIDSLDLSKNIKLQEIYIGDNRTMSIVLPETDSKWTDVQKGFDIDTSATFYDGGDTVSAESLSGEYGYALYRFDLYSKITLDNNIGESSIEKAFYCFSSFYISDFNSWSGISPAPEGKEIVSWNTSKDGSGENYYIDFGFLFEPPGNDRVFYAQWADIDPATSVEINETNFPDKAFRVYVSKVFDKNADAILTEKEINNVISFCDQWLTTLGSLKGIENFPKLKSILCSSVNLTVLDVSQNSELESLHCYDTGITSLDLSKNINLKELACSGNNLTELDLSKNINLEYIHCGSNGVELSLTLPDTDSRWSGDEHGFADSISLYNGDETITVNGRSSYYKLDNCTNYTKVNLNNNLNENNDTRVYYCRGVAYADDLSKAFAAPSGKELASWNTKADGSGQSYSIDVDYGFIPGEEKTLYAQWADIDPATSVEINETNFPDEVFRDYVFEEFDKNGNGILTEREINNITYISVGLSGVKSLKGIENFANLESLDCFANSISELDLSNNPKLKELFCEINDLTELDVSANSKLTKLVCISNALEKLNVSNNPELVELDCSSNDLTELDVSANSKLTKLDCDSNTLEELDVSNNLELTELNCRHNKLAELNLSSNSKLTKLDCDSNTLEELNVSNNPELTELNCSYNNLAELNLSSNLKLTKLNCLSNRFKKLDLINNINLESIYCGYNGVEFSLTFPDTESMWTDSDSCFEGNISLYNGGEIITVNSYIDAKRVDTYVKIIFNKNYGEDNEVRVFYYDNHFWSNSYLSDVFEIPDGKELLSWNTEPDGSGENYNLGTSYWFDSGEELLLYAQWEDIDPATSVVINDTSFPDKVFRDYVSEELDKDGNEILTTKEMNAVTDISLPWNAVVKSLSGIEHFRNLEQLICTESDIPELDLTVFNKLRYVNCSNMRCPMEITINEGQADSLRIISRNSAIKKFTVSGLEEGTYSVFEYGNGNLEVVNVLEGKITIPESGSDYYTAYWVAKTENDDYYYKPGAEYDIPAGLLITETGSYYSTLQYTFFGLLDGKGGTLSNGSTFSGGYVQHVSGSDLVLYDMNFHKDGAAFVGVKGGKTGTEYYDINSENFLDILRAEIEENQTAIFEAIYKNVDGDYICYNGNGATTAEGETYFIADGFDFSKGEPVTIAGNSFVSEEDFICWSDSSDGNGEIYGAGESAEIENSITLYAIFGHSLVKYNRWNGESFASTDGGAVYGFSERDVNFLFKGWNTKEDGSGQWYYPGENIERGAVLELYEIWESADVSDGYVRYISDRYTNKEGSFHTVTDGLDFSEGTLKIKLIDNPFEIKEDETFFGWRNDSDIRFYRGELYKPGEEIEISKSTDLYAVVGKNRVVYHWNGGNKNYTNSVIDSKAICWNNGKNTGEPLFKGWNTEADGSGTWWLPGQAIPVGTDIELYEVDELSGSDGYTYTLANYDDGSGTVLHKVSMESETEEITLPENGGFGWYKGTLRGTTIYSNEIIPEGTKVTVKSGDVYSALNATLVVRLHDNLAEDRINNVSLRYECPASPVNLRQLKEYYKAPENSSVLTLLGFNSKPDGSGLNMTGEVSQGIYDFYAQWKIDSEAEIKAESQTMTEDSYTIPEALEDEYSSVAEIKSALESAVIDNNKESGESVRFEGSALMDINLSYAGAGQENYSELTDNLIPETGVKVNLTYDDLGLDSSAAGYIFSGAHMFDETSGKNEAGTIECLDIDSDENGISFVLHGTSPVLITWVDPEREFGITLTDESNGGNLKVKASAYNDSEEDISASVIAAVYDRNGKQLECKMGELNVAKRSEGDTTLQFSKKAENGYEIKAYMIEAGKYVPLCESVRL